MHLIVPLEVHELTLADDIYDPFGIDISTSNYITPMKPDDFSKYTTETGELPTGGHKLSLGFEVQLHMNGHMRV